MISARRLRKNAALYSLLAPALLYFLVFSYVPIYGLQIAFKDYSPFVGFMGSPWVGLEHFYSFFDSIYFTRLVGNTLAFSVYSLIFGFPAPIMLALILNELKGEKFRSLFQTVSYMPHFISTVIMCGIIVNFLSPSTGIINLLIVRLGGQPVDFMRKAELFRTIYVTTGIWQGIGWSSIIYYASLRAVDPTLYEAATIDGANRWQKMAYISIQSILPTIVTLLLLNLGGLMSVGYEKIYLLYNTSTMKTADVISTYVYRAGLTDQQYSFAAAVGLFNSAINLTLLTVFNKLSKMVFSQSLW